MYNQSCRCCSVRRRCDSTRSSTKSAPRGQLSSLAGLRIHDLCGAPILVPASLYSAGAVAIAAASQLSGGCSSWSQYTLATFTGATGTFTRPRRLSCPACGSTSYRACGLLACGPIPPSGKPMGLEAVVWSRIAFPARGTGAFSGEYRFSMGFDVPGRSRSP